MTTIPTAEEITRDWGERCPDFEPGCFCCQMWAMHDEIGRLRGVSAGGEKVKALEWGCIVPISESIVGTYSIHRIGGEWRVRLSVHPHIHETQIASGKSPDFETALIDAKAAAQADYERRILSALASRPTDGMNDPLFTTPVSADEDGDLPQSPWPASDWAIDRISALEAALKPFADSVQPDDSTTYGWRFGFQPSAEDKYLAHRVYYDDRSPAIRQGDEERDG
jgi:hypothetical protein